MICFLTNLCYNANSPTLGIERIVYLPDEIENVGLAVAWDNESLKNAICCRNYVN